MEGVGKFQLDVGPEIFRGAIGWGLDNSSLCSWLEPCRVNCEGQPLPRGIIAYQRCYL
jgi:hypothetical protein